MPYVDLYGRNPNIAATTFHYAYPLVGQTPPAPGRRFFFKPPQSSPIFGVEQLHVPDIGDNVVILDPTNDRYTSQRDRGGLGSYFVDADIVENEGITGVTAPVGEGMMQDMGQGGLMSHFKQSEVERTLKRSDAKAYYRGRWDSIGDFYRRASGPAQMAMAVVGGLIVWNLVGRRRR